ncbi:MAG TPA: MBL fold metallo-hydrolase, partial [Gemmatimonadaceae bacterium]|nr:MBL fold metallo-hydrolase [Gemmatimonadaceae bacterium]
MSTAALAVAPAVVLLSGGIAPFEAHVPSVALPAAADTVRTAASALAQQVKVTVLSTMLSGDPGRGIGEGGFAALLEVDGRRLLIDTGARPGTVMQNARELGIDLSAVEEVVLTHNHGDHANGLVALRESVRSRNPRALAVAHVAPAILFRRPLANGDDGNGLSPHREA